MKVWWITDPARFAREKSGVEALAAEGWFSFRNWTVHDYKLAAIGDISVEGHQYPVRLVYADQFPQVPAWVEPVDPKARWSNHQYGRGGTLCLELRPDNWTPSATGSDVLRSAYNLLRIENPHGTEHAAVESAHRVGQIQSYASSSEPVLIGGYGFLRLVDGTSSNLRAQRSPGDRRVWPIYLFDDEDVARGTAPPPTSSHSTAIEVRVSVVRAAPPDPLPQTRTELCDALGIGSECANDGSPLVVLTISEGLVTPFHCFEDGSVFPRKLVVINDIVGQRSGQRQEIQKKRLAIVGCGSAGSKIAESLIRCGVRRFVLIDGDIFLPGNLERHVLDWRDVGYQKVNALQRRLESIAPNADVTVVGANLNWQRSASSHSDQLDMLAACDLIIDATGDPPTSLFLGAIASNNERPFVSVEVYEGGIGALVARSVPGRDAAYSEGRQAFVGYCEQQNVPPPESGNHDYEAIFDGIPIVADDSAVTAAAGHAVRITMDVLNNSPELEGSAWLLFGFRRGWLFNQHGHNILLNVGGANMNFRNEDDVDESVRQLALDLARKAIDAAKNPD